MAQRTIEILLGRLISDEAFRESFLADGFVTLQGFVDAGHELTPLEIRAVLATPAEFWSEAAERVDSRLQKASLARKH